MTGTATAVVRVGIPRRGAASRTSARTFGLLAAVTVLAAACALSLAIGAKGIDPSVVWGALWAGPDALTDDEYIVASLRLPRTIAGLLVGASLGVAGALIQALTRNPLADTGILGVDAGAALMITIGIGAFGVTSVAGYAWFAFAGALITTVLVYLIGASASGSTDPIRLLLAGVALAAVFTGLATALTLIQPDLFDAIRNWTVGSLVNRGYAVTVPLLPFIGAGLLLAALSARSLNSIALGDDLARSLGVHVTRTRVLVVAAVTLLAGAATAIAGPIAFVGLMVPHLARWIVGPDQRWILPYSAVLAAVLVLVSDVVGRLVVWPNEMAVGIVTAFVGAPVLIALVRSRRKLSGL